MSSALSSLFGWLANSWVLSILGLILLTLLIWVFGPAVAVGDVVPLAAPLARLGLIAGIWIGWLVWKLVGMLHERRTNAAIVETLAADAGRPDEARPGRAGEAGGEDEVALLSERFREALATLKSARLGGKGERRYLHQLPWYLMIGPPGGGKTTAIVNSGLKFPLLDRFGRDSIRGVGGTRNCDWFFTDEAVLVDTAGRYVTQDSHAAADRFAWQGFLNLLRRYRRRRPIDGIIVAIGIDEIIGADAAKREGHAEAVRRRVQEVSETLQVRAPVYVVFTKCDLIAGFTEFFSDLRQSDAAQVWGITFPLNRSRRPGSALQALPGEFDALLDRLAARVVMRLEQESDLQRRARVLSFPQQVALLKEPVADFLSRAFAESRYDRPALLRGIYLSSATQEGTPIDRLVGTLSRTFGFPRPSLPALSQRGRAFFLTSLFRDVIFKEAALVTATGFFDRNRALLLRGFYGLAAAATGLIVAGMVISYSRNDAYVAEVDAAAAEYEERYRLSPPGRGNIIDNLWYLTRLRDIPGGWGDRTATAPLLSRFGLYQGDKLGSAAIAKYRDGLNNILMPDVMSRLEEQLGESITAARSGREGSGPSLYETLRVYLMMTEPAVRDAGYVALWITSDWEQRYPGARNTELRETFNDHLEALIELRRRPFPENAALVAAARQELLRTPLANRIYDQIRDRAPGGREYGWSLALRPPAYQRFFELRSGRPLTTGVPGLFTPEGYRLLFRPRLATEISRFLDETWVLDPGRSGGAEPGPDRLQVSLEVSELYFADYIRVWQQLIDDLDVVTARDIRAQDQIVERLSRPGSPLKSLLEAISRETTLAPPDRPDGAGRATEEPPRLDSLRRLLDGESAGDTATASDPAGKVDHYFQPMHALVTAGEAGPAPIDAALAVLRPLGDCLSDAALALPGTTAGGLQPGQDLIARCRRAAFDVDTEARFQPAPLGRWLGTLANHSFLLVTGTVRDTVDRSIQDAWRSRVLVECQRRIAGRYPLVPSSSNDVALGDFARFFGPNGSIDQFFNEYIRPAVDTGQRPWQWRREAPVGISASSLALFETAAAIRDTFFPGASPSPQVAFEVMPLTLDKASAQVALEIGSQRLRYGHGPVLRQPFQWPAPGQPGARVVFTPLDGGPTPTVAADGDWAPFRLLDQGGARAVPGSDRLRVTFEADGHRAAFEIRTRSVINPFALPELTRFRCQDRL